MDQGDMRPRSTASAIRLRCRDCRLDEKHRLDRDYGRDYPPFSAAFEKLRANGVQRDRRRGHWSGWCGPHTEQRSAIGLLRSLIVNVCGRTAIVSGKASRAEGDLTLPGGTQWPPPCHQRRHIAARRLARLSRGPRRR